MNEGRRQILEMLAAGKITADEAERLMAALESPASASAQSVAASAANGAAVDQHEGAAEIPARAGGGRRVDDRAEGRDDDGERARADAVCCGAGVRLASLIPQQAHDKLDEALSKHGVPITLSQIKPENLEELIDHLEDLTVDVDGKDGNQTKVRVFCE